jgi:ADP-ribose pyrophosphatase YjhB (NUDIX family)
MLTFEQDGCRFNYRVAGVAFRDDEVLLHKEQNDDFWTLPGGRVEMGESSADGFEREMREELAVDVEVTRLLWVVENFFEYDNRPYHEVAFYYLFALPNDCPPMAARERFRGCEADATIEFRWCKLTELSLVRLLPRFLADGLKALPRHPVHIVHRDA